MTSARTADRRALPASSRSGCVPNSTAGRRNWWQSLLSGSKKFRGPLESERTAHGKIHRSRWEVRRMQELSAVRARPVGVAGRTGPFRMNRELPVFLIPFAASPGVVPTGILHLIVPSFRSYATSSDQGGLIAIIPLFASSTFPNGP